MSETVPTRSTNSNEGERRRLLNVKGAASSSSSSQSSLYDATTKGEGEEGNKSVQEKTEKQKYLEFAVYALEFMLITFMSSIIIATFLTLFYEMDASYMPLWVIFSVV